MESWSLAATHALPNEVLTEDKTPGQVAKAYGVHANTVGIWKRQFLDKGPVIFAKGSAVQEYESRIAELEQLLGKKEVEIAVVKNFLGRSGWSTSTGCRGTQLSGACFR